ncbi:MAG: metallophosphoesterase family protein [Gemmobacter sp.]
MAFRFVHTADIHLDSPLRSLALRDPALSARVGAATREAFRGIVDLCLAEAVDALLIAGDLYDGSQTSMKTARFLVAELGRLEAAGIATCIIRGNHDSVAAITRELVLPPSVHVFGARAGVRRFADGAVAVHGISFADRHAPDSLLPWFGAPVAGAVNIGMMHTSLNGAAGHDVYAPCALPDLMASGFAYWALGHVHRRAVHLGAATVVMPGMPQGRDMGEAGPKSVTLVTVGDDGRIALEERATALLQFARVPVEAAGLADWPALVAAVGQALRQARREMATPDLILRPVIKGADALAWRLARDRDLVLAEAQSAAEAIGTVWIDKVEVAGGAGAVPAGALGELAALLAEPSPAALAEGAAAVEALVRALPPSLRDDFGAEEARADLVRALMAEGAAEVLARLAGGEG